MKHLTKAEQILRSLGITEPSEIDIEAIAWSLGVRVKFRPLDGCEARIIGDGQKAIVTVNDRSSMRRSRFSIAHELGHWEFDRGQIMVYRSDDIGNFAPKGSHAEKRANRYAADLLMPNYLFRPVARTFRQLDFNIISQISDIFGTSLMASAIRFIELGDHPAILVCHKPNGRAWFVRSPLIPARWFPRDDLQPESSAMDVLFGKRTNDPRLQCVDADAWFDRFDAHKFEICEQTCRVSNDEVLSLLVIEDEEMLED